MLLFVRARFRFIEKVCFIGNKTCVLRTLVCGEVVIVQLEVYLNKRLLLLKAGRFVFRQFRDRFYFLFFAWLRFWFGHWVLVTKARGLNYVPLCHCPVHDLRGGDAMDWLGSRSEWSLGLNALVGDIKNFELWFEHWFGSLGEGLNSDSDRRLLRFLLERKLLSGSHKLLLVQFIINYLKEEQWVATQFGPCQRVSMLRRTTIPADGSKTFCSSTRLPSS
jgi:hypothetical protein